MTDHSKAWLDRIVRVVERLGVASVALGFVSWAVWTVGNRILDEVAIPLANSHMKAVDQLSETMEEVNETLKGMDGQAASGVQLLIDTHTKVEQIHAKVVTGTK